MGYQNFFATRLFTDIGAADTTITLENPPTPTSGRLVLEARNTSKREIISYTGVSGNDITGVTRGVGGTSATDHTKNSLVEMNVVAEDLSDALAVPSDIITRFDETISDHVASGLVWTDDTGLTADMSAGVAYINGIRLDVAAVNNRAFTASKDTYVDLGDNGVLDYNEVSNGAAAPSLAASHIRLARVVTNATDTTSITNFINPSFLLQNNDWKLLPIAVSSVVNNGNGSQDITFASSIASILSPGMKLRTVRSVFAPTYMGGLFNGSSHYFVKTSPTSTLSTVVNNFSMKATVIPTAYANGTICGRVDGTIANGLRLSVNSTGQVEAVIWNAGAGNSRSITSYQSLPLNKKSRLWISWASGTVVMKINGYTVSTYTTTAGTAPTSAGTGGDFAVGRNGSAGSNYFAGYISDVAVFDAVIAPSTMLSYDGQVITGAETNCIGAWSLNNTAVNQVAPGTNDLTATGGVGYTSGKSPYSTSFDEVSNGLVDFALVMSVSGSTATVQVPEGCTIPTSGGVSLVHYGYGNPFGWISHKDRWRVLVIGKYQPNAAGTASTWVNLGYKINVPVGGWDLEYSAFSQVTHAGTTFLNVNLGLSTANNTGGEDRLIGNGVITGVSNNQFGNNAYRKSSVLLTTATDYFLNSQPSHSSTTVYQSQVTITATPSSL